MNIPELKKAMEILEAFIKYKGTDIEVGVSESLDTLISACQLLCDVSDKMEPKKEDIEKIIEKFNCDSSDDMPRLLAQEIADLYQNRLEKV